MKHYEIEACVIRAKNGSKEELLKLMEQYKAFIFKSALKYNIRGYDLYDLVQIGYVALINAVAKYREGSNTFSTYALNAIENSLRYTARGASKENGDVSLNTPYNSDEGDNREYIDCIEAPGDLEEEVIQAGRVKELRKAVSKLPSDELEFVLMVYYNGASIKTYAEKKGLSYPQAMRKKVRILKKLGVLME
jgi:RNA polymerase sporulation-specific sigma factor